MNSILDPDEMPKWLSTIWNKKDYKGIYAGINDDDCAIIEISKDLKIVITTDYLNYSPIGLELGVSNHFDIGRLIVCSNISDLCGTGAEPIAFLLGIMLKKGTNQGVYKKIVKGVKYELDKIKIPLIGGDSKLGNENTYYGIAIGVSNSSRKLFTKQEALPEDNLWISGYIGNVSAAVYGLSNKIMNLKWNKWAYKIINDPILPITKSQKIAKLLLGNGGTDISDGLGADALSMAQLSKVGVVINPNLIPISEEVHMLAKETHIPAWYFAFTIGGDFQFLVTSNQKNDSLMEKIGMKKIGRITKNQKYLIEIEHNKFHPMPIIGHRDKNKSSFSKEVNNIIDTLKFNLKIRL